MRLILIATSLATYSFLAHSPLPADAQQHYARWSWEDVGTHHLPTNWSVDWTQGDFDGLVAGYMHPNEWEYGHGGGPNPVAFNVHTGDLIQISEESANVLEVHGSEVLTNRQHYDHASGETTTFGPFDGPDYRFADAMNAHGEIVFAGPREIPIGSQRILTVGDHEILPPWEVEVAPGIMIPATAYLQAYGFSDAGWVAGWFEAEGVGDGGFAANIHTDEFRVLDQVAWAVNDHGEVAMQGEPATTPDVPLGDARRYFQPAQRSINNHGQAVYALKYEDDGTILALAPGPIVQVHNTDDDWLVDVQTSKLVRGEPLFIAGDYDVSGRVDQGDLNAVLLNWGGDAEDATGWFHDLPTGRVDQDELNGLLLRWGATDGVPVLGSQPVPEPNSLLLALNLAGVLLACLSLTRAIARRR